MLNKFLITVFPGCGKTSLIKELVKESNQEFAGFYTEEIKENGARTGFEIRFLSGQYGILASKHLQSSFRVGSYGVDLRQFESLIKGELLNINNASAVLIDEIGKMEMCSGLFKKLVQELFQSEKLLLATIMYKPHPFADSIKRRKDVSLIELNRENYIEIKKQILNLISVAKNRVVK